MRTGALREELLGDRVVLWRVELDGNFGLEFACHGERSSGEVDRGMLD